MMLLLHHHLFYGNQRIYCIKYSMVRNSINPVSMLCTLLGLALLCLARMAAGEPPQDTPLVFGFLPIVSSERLVRRFSPLTEYLSRTLDAEIRMETAPDFHEFVHRTRDGRRYDILFTAPHLYYLAHANPGYQAIVRVDRPGMKAVVVTRADSRIDSIQDLRGRRLATTDPLALATVLARSLLQDSGLDPDRDLSLVATPSHNASLLSSYRGTTDASVLILPLYRRARADIRDSTKIVAETGSAPHMPLAVAPWVDAGFVARLRTALLEMKDTPHGRALLQHLDWPGFAPAEADDYDALGHIAEQLDAD